MTDNDFYARLEVTHSCTDLQLQAAYRKKALALHPLRKDSGKENAQSNSTSFRDISQVLSGSLCPPAMLLHKG
jgi:DnaJ-class molecular chaperone